MNRPLAADFAEIIRTDPHAIHGVLIVFASPEAARRFIHPQAFRPMDVLAAVPLSGHEILRLADQDGVLSIEPDRPMQALLRPSQGA